MNHEISHPNKKTPAQKAASVVLALAVLSGAGAAVNKINENNARSESFNQPGLAQDYETGNIPQNIADEQVVKVTLNPGSNGWNTVDGIAKSGRTDELAGMIDSQTEGQPGTAIVPESYINMNEAQVTYEQTVVVPIAGELGQVPGGIACELPEVSEPR